MKKIILLAVVSITALFSCKKNVENNVSLRIENKTTQNFKEVQSNGQSFGTVNAGAITEYKQFEKIVDVPFVTLITASDTISAGKVYIDFPSYYTRGKYTLQIITDTSAYYGYDCVYKKS